MGNKCSFIPNDNVSRDYSQRFQNSSGFWVTKSDTYTGKLYRQRDTKGNQIIYTTGADGKLTENLVLAVSTTGNSWPVINNPAWTGPFTKKTLNASGWKLNSTGC